MHKYTHTSQERRLLYKQNFDNLRDKIVEPNNPEDEGASAEETEKQREERLESLGKLSADTIKTYQEELKTFPDNLQAKFETELHEYFETSLEGFDKNDTEGLNAEEYDAYKSHLREKIDSNMTQLSASLGTIKDEAEKEEKEMEEKTEQAEEDQRNVDALKSDIETFKAETIEPLTLDPSQLEQVQDPAVVEEQLQEYQDHFVKLQESQVKMMELSSSLFAYQEKAQESLKLLDTSVDAGGAAAAVAAGATIGTAVGGWAFGLGTVIGAVGGAIAYGVSKGVAAMAMAEEKQKQADAANAVIEAGKQKFTAGKNAAIEASNQFSAEGDKFNAAPEAFRLNAEELAVAHEAEYQKNTEDLGQVKTGKEAELLRIQETRKQMQEQRDALVLRREFIAQQQLDADQKGEEIRLTKEEMRGNITQVDDAIATVKEYLKTATGDKKAKLQAKLQQLTATRDNSDKGVSALEEGGANIESSETELQQELIATEEMGVMVEGQDMMLLDATDMLDQSIADLGETEAELLAEKESFSASMELGVQNIDQIDNLIADNVFSAEVRNLGSLGNLESQEKLLSGIKDVEAPGFVSSLSDGFDGFGKAAEWLFVDTVSGSLDAASEWLQEATADIPVLSQVTYGATELLLGVPSGLMAGTGELLGGVATMLGHPVQTVTGLSALVGLNPDVSAGTAWTELGKALIAYDEYADGNVGKATGKVALNVLLTATGAGAAANGGKAAAMAFRAARAAGQGVMRASLKAGMVGGRIALTRFATGAVKAPGNILRGVGKFAGGVLKAPYSIGKMLLSSTDEFAKIEASVASHVDELAAASGKASDILTKSGLPQELAGMSVDELLAISRSGDDLVRLGIDGSQMIDDFLRYQSAMKKVQQAALALKLAEESRHALLAADDAKVAAQMTEKMEESLPVIRQQAEARVAAAVEAGASADDIAKLEKHLQVIDDILEGKVTLENYKGIRDIKSLSIQEQQILAQKVLKNSGKTIDEMLNMEKTLGASRTVSAQAKAEMLAMKLDEFTGQGCKSISEGIRNGSVNYKSLSSIDDAIRALPAGVERTMLVELSDDLAGMVEKGLVTADEAGVILRDSAEFMDDYAAALKEGGFKGSSVTTADDMFNLVRKNQRKLAHQTVVDRAYLTGSDHGILHVVEGDMRMATEMADELIAQGRMSAREKVLLRQSIIDHDMGYTMSSLEQYGVKGNSLKGLGEGYYAMTKDHPLYSGILHDSHAAEYMRYFGEDGYKAMTVLDHSDPAGALRAVGELTAGAAPRYDVVQWLITHADPMGVSADVKMMKLFQDPAMMEQLAKVMGPADEFGAFKGAKELIAKGEAAADDIAAAQQLVDNFPIQKNLKELAAVRRNMKAMIRQRYAGSPDMERFVKAVDRFCDPRSPQFAATRDFGSHSLNYKGVALQGDKLVATFQVNEVFSQVGKAFGNPKMQASAAMKALDDFGYAVPKDKVAQFAERLGSLGDETVKVEQLIDEGLVAIKKGAKPDTTFVFEGAGTAAQTADNLALSNVLRRQTALKEALSQLDTVPKTIDEFDRVVSSVAQKFDETYSVTIAGQTRTAPQVFDEVGQLIQSGEFTKAQQLLKQLRDFGRGTMRSAA